MIGDLFDSPWKVLIVAVVLIVLFGSKKLPDAARSLGKSMRILKTEVSDLHHEDAPADRDGMPEAQFRSAQLTPAPVVAPAEQQSQIDALQQQIRDLQRASTMDAAPVGVPSEPQRTQQPS
jgi:sec-independent protein translocase protein TatA